MTRAMLHQNVKTLVIANNLDLRFSNSPRGYSTSLDLAMV